VFYVQLRSRPRPFDFQRGAGRGLLAELPEDDSARAAYLGDAAVERLTDPAELGLLRQLPSIRVIEAAAVAHEPHRIAFYLYDLASEFHALFSKGNESPHLRFIMTNDAEITKGANWQWFRAWSRFWHRA